MLFLEFRHDYICDDIPERLAILKDIIRKIKSIDDGY
jgi:hypothetical protein